jgi:LuxR family maltose regulon positive regulatory protein
MTIEKYLVSKNLLLEPLAAAPVQVGSPQWVAWLCGHQRFRFEGSGGHFYAQREMRRDVAYWYAYRRRGGRLFKMYLGKPGDLTPERLEQAGLYLAGQTPSAGGASIPAASELMAALNRPPHLSAAAPEVPEPSLSILPLTKIKPPFLPEKLIARPRLTQLIKMPLTVIYAPSGFGKSTLLNEWRLTCGYPVAWVSLDEGDNQALRFWSTIGMALQTIRPDFGQIFLSHLRAHSASDLSQVVVGVTNEIVRATDSAGAFEHIGLVLDDYHHIQRPEIHASLQTLLEYLPAGLRLVISSHTRPPLALGHLRAMGKMAELTIDDLRFTVEEGINFLAQSPHVRQLSYNELQALVRHTEGWVAGLNLATLALAQQGDQNQLIEAFTGAHSYLREYFMESVLHQQPGEVQSFLLKTAILKHLSGPLCDAVTGQTGGTAMLAHLLQENLFLERLEEQNWFRYHDLFAEMLYSQLQMQFPAEIPLLHRRASEWYRAQNAPADAIYHLLTIQAWDEATSLIEHMALHELEQFGEDSRLLRWLQQLPESVVQQHKTLLSVYIRLAGVALPGLDVESFLARVEANITGKPVEELTPDEQEVLSDTQRFRNIIGAGGPVISQASASEDHEAMWHLLNGLVAYQRNHCKDVDCGAALAREVYESARAKHNLFVILIAGGGYANLTLLQGFLRRSERIARQVLQQAISLRGTLPEPASFALTVLSQVCYERNELSQAHQLLMRAAEVDPNPTSTNASISAAILRAKIQAAQGNPEAARITLQAARELHSRRPAGVWIDQDLIAYQVLYCLRQSDCIDAELMLGETELTEPHPLSIYVRAEVFFHRGQNASAEELLTHLLTQYPHGFYSEPIMSARVLLALVLFEQHKINQARQVISEAVRSAAPESFIRPFIEQDAQLIPLLTLVLHTENLTPEARTFIKEILRLLERAGKAGKPSPMKIWRRSQLRHPSPPVNRKCCACLRRACQIGRLP